MNPRFASLFVLAACSGAPRSPSAPAVDVPPEMSPALAPLAWWLGSWQSWGGACVPDDEKADTPGNYYLEHWVAAAGALYGIAFTHQGYEVMIVDDGDGPAPADGVLRFLAMPGGAKSVEFRQQAVGDRTVTFANPAHDDPKTITYSREDDVLRAVLHGTQHLKFEFCAWQRTPAPEIEAADRAFSQDTGRRGIEGWLAAFEPGGGMIRNGERIEGDAIRTAMGPLLAKGTLAWEPIASARDDRHAFTVGKATFTGTTPSDGWQSSYVTIWKLQSDGTWKVAFDVGRVVNAP